MHRPNEGEELAELVGDPWVHGHGPGREPFRARRRQRTSTSASPQTRGTPVKLDRRFVEADLRIATGLVEPHFMAGWSGGRKVIAPGVAHDDTIRTFHCARFMEDPLRDPVQPRRQSRCTRSSSRSCACSATCYALNTVIDEERDLVYVNFGEVIASHLAAVASSPTASACRCGRRFKTIVTSAAGYPLDKTYYQTVKGHGDAARHPRAGRRR